MIDRGNETSRALTEVRTVLSRAETALDALSSGPMEYITEHDADGRYLGYRREPDPEQEAMVEALRAAVVALTPWRRAGARRRGR